VCGIAGIITKINDSNLEFRCQMMAKSIQHRGPDSSGYIVQDGVALSHTRLSIIDLSHAASQPMQKDGGDLSIVFNGEIYNYSEIRSELQKLGIIFETKSDTEVLIMAYKVWGISFIHKLNGIFAFSILDIKNSVLILARDRLGVKPLYWLRDSNEILFGSEIKAVASAMDSKISLDKEGLLEYLSFQNHLGEKTIFNNIELFPSSSYALINIENLSLTIHKFWQPEIYNTYENEAIELLEIEQSLNHSVARQLIADVEVSSFLSGGIDSCILASLATKSLGKIKTFTCGFSMKGVSNSELLFDERSIAELVAEELGAQHFEVFLTGKNFKDNMYDWAWHAEEPRVGSSFPNYCVSKLASKFTKVCLSGTGGDELFGGYPWRYEAAKQANSFDEFANNYFKFWHRMMSPNDFNAIAEPLLYQSNFDSYEIFREKLKGCNKRASLSKTPLQDTALIFEIETFLQSLLIVEDKASMASGLEVRVPLLDNQMIDTALKISYNSKVGVCKKPTINSFYGSGSSDLVDYNQGKRILREVGSKYIPNEIIGRRKQGFSPPFDTWFKTELKDWLVNSVVSNHSPLNDFLDLKVARKLLNDHFSGASNNRLLIWGLVSLFLSITAFVEA
jgi:asparagine synthase (glutamine-hydrolysing)